MLIIRDEQIEALGRARIAGFTDQMVAYIRREYPHHQLSQAMPQTRAFVESAIVSARQLRISSSGALAVLIELRLLYGDNLERAPDRAWARNILAHPTLPDHIRVGTVQERLSERTGGRTLVVHQEQALAPVAN